MRSLTPVLALLIGCSGGMNPPGNSAVDPSKSSLEADKTSVTANNQDTVRITATVRDADGKGLGGVKVTFSITGGSEQSSNTSNDGIANANFSSEKAEEKTVTVKAELNGTTTELGTKTITFVAGPAEGIRFKVQPTTTKAGTPISPAVVLEVTDGRGNVVANDNSFMASLRLVRSSGGSVQNGTAIAAVNGVITFPNLIINRVQLGYALRAETMSGAADESVMFDVIAGDLSAATSTLTATPVNVVAGAMTTLSLTAKDLGGNTLGGQQVTFSASGDGTFDSSTVTT
ncbi:MAG: Ig-like domain-containing protein, partial [Archangium sp.]